MGARDYIPSVSAVHFRVRFSFQFPPFPYARQSLYVSVSMSEEQLLTTDAFSGGAGIKEH